ncbi:glycosyltransferase [Jannaschia marina]|uniref:glycosyltransferase n=1 Tax=Jannaschia marina TaxID=2741674 RepID=UPI0015CA82BF|nr:glycosyltransferase [Jannaschia marina]
MSDLQILAITRFAYPGLGGYQTEHETVEARKAHLWHPDRMEARLRTLEHVSLRTLSMQSDSDFRTLVITGADLPEPWRGRLERIVSGLKGGTIVYHPDEPYRDAIRNAVLPHIDPEGPPVLQFRHDDDDGVARRFVARARETFTALEHVWAQHKRLTIDFNRGYLLNLTPDGPRVEETFLSYICIAQAIVLAPTNRRTALHFPHHRLGTLMPSFTLPDAPMWLRGIDGTNDSGQAGQLKRLKPADEEQKRVLRRRFALDLKAIRESF